MTNNLQRSRGNLRNVAEADKKDDGDELYLEIVFTPCQKKYEEEHGNLCKIFGETFEEFKNKEINKWKTSNKIVLLNSKEYFSSACISDDELKEDFEKKLNPLLQHTINILRIIWTTTTTT